MSSALQLLRFPWESERHFMNGHFYPSGFIKLTGPLANQWGKQVKEIKADLLVNGRGTNLFIHCAAPTDILEKRNIFSLCLIKDMAALRIVS